MECPLKTGDAAELIVEYGAHTLDPEATARFEQHMQSCAACRELAASQQAVWSALDEWRPLPVSADFDEKVFQRIAAGERAGWWRRLWTHGSWQPAIPVAAACAVLAIAFLMKSPDQSAPAPLSQPKLQIEQVEHALDDMDMLKQLGVEVTPERAGSEKI